MSEIDKSKQATSLIEKNRRDSIVIYEKLLEGFLDSKEFQDPFFNVYALFFPDLMRILTGYVIKKNEQEILGEIHPIPLSISVSRLPFIDYRDVSEGVQTDRKQFEFEPTPPSRRIDLMELLSKIPFSPKKKLSVSRAIDIEEAFFWDLIKSGFHFEFVKEAKFYLPNASRQIEDLKNTIKEAFLSIGFESHAEGMLQLIESHIKTYLLKSISDQEPFFGDALLVGTMSTLVHRVHAAKARQAGKPVISVSHGSGDQAMYDEPRMGYGERSYATHFFGYGQGGEKKGQKSLFLQELYEPHFYRVANCDICADLFQTKKVKTLKSEHLVHLLYVPDSYESINCYGPYGSISDELYLKWQRKLTSQLKTLDYKRHPKGYPTFANMQTEEFLDFLGFDASWKGSLKEQPFSDILQEYEGFVFDHIGTAFMIAAATDKPVFYLDLGRRKLKEEALALLKKRVYYAEIDLDDVPELEDLFSRFVGQERENLLTPSYSLDVSHQKEKRRKQLLSYLKEVMNGS